MRSGPAIAPSPSAATRAPIRACVKRKSRRSTNIRAGRTSRRRASRRMAAAAAATQARSASEGPGSNFGGQTVASAAVPATFAAPPAASPALPDLAPVAAVGDDTEIVFIIRSKRDPSQRSEVYVVDQAAPDL